MVDVRFLADGPDRRCLTGVIEQLPMTMLAAACALAGVVLRVAGTGPFILLTVRLYAFLAATLSFFGFVLAACLALVFRRPAPG